MPDPHAAPKKAPPETNFLGPPQQPGELGRLGSYRVLKILGHGGMGMVFLADDPQLKRSVALKVMLPKVAQNPGYRQALELSVNPSESGKIRRPDLKKMKELNLDVHSETGLLRDGKVVPFPDFKGTAPFDPPIEAARPMGEWNDVEIVSLNGTSIHLLNGRIVGVVAGNTVLRDGKAAERIHSGNIALRSLVDGEAFVRRLEIRPISALPAEVVAAWRPLLAVTGSPPLGWKIVRDPAKSVKFTSAAGPGGLVLGCTGDGTLAPLEPLKNYHLRMEYKWPDDALGHFALHYYGDDKSGLDNSGFALANLLKGETKWGVQGKPTNVADEAVLKDGRFAVKAQARDATLTNKAQKTRGEWNTLELICLDGTVLHRLNGELLFAITKCRKLLPDGREEPITSGQLGLSVFGPVQFRRIEYREISSIPAEVVGIKSAP